MYNSQIIALRIETQLKMQKKTKRELLENCGLGKNALSCIKAGNEISVYSLAKIADYLECSIDYLMCRADSPDDVTRTTTPSMQPAPVVKQTYQAAATMAAVKPVEPDLSNARTYSTEDVANRIYEKLKQMGIPSSRMLKELGFNINYLAQFRAGKKIPFDRLAVIADYLDCSVDELLGR